MNTEQNWENEGEEGKSQPLSSFVPGDKVVCMDDDFSSVREKKVFSRYERGNASMGGLIIYPVPPKKGTVYVVRRADADCIYLVGVAAGKFGVEDEVGFSPCRFMLLSEYREAQQARKHKCGF